jgi:hypothetical protein
MRINVLGASTVLAAVIAVVSICPSAHAGINIYANVNASSCVPGDQSIQFDRYTISAGKIFHNPSNKDLITLYCPVELPSYTVNTLFMTTNDWDGSATATDIDITLLRINRNTGITSSLGTYSSSASGDGWREHTITSFIPDRDTYVYYVRVDLIRDAALPGHDAIVYKIGVGSIY